MRKSLFATLALSCALAGGAEAADGQADTRAGGPAAAPSTALLGNVDFAVDDAGVHLSNVRLGGLHPCGAYLDDLGFAARSMRELRIDEARDTTTLARTLGSRAIADKGIKAEAGFVQIAGRTRVVGDATWNAPPVAGTTLAVVAAGDIVGTPSAIDRGIAYGFIGGSVERALADRITANGVAGYQTFTDGNERMHLRARLTWRAAPAFGLEAQLRWRQYERREDGLDTPYFNPEHYAQWQGVLDLRRKFGALALSGAVGAGVETVDGTDRHPVRTAEMRVEGLVLDKLRLSVYARYNRSTDDADLPDSSYRQAGMTLSYPF
jgi:hypothetical protein